MNSSITCWLMAGPKLGKGRPPADYKLTKIESGSKVKPNLELRELALEWNPGVLSTIDSKRLFKYWASIKGLTNDRLVWNTSDSQDVPLCDLEYSKEGTFVYRVYKQKIRNSALEPTAISLWNTKRSSSVSDYLEHHLKAYLLAEGVFSTLELRQEAPGIIKHAQFLMFSSEDKLMSLLYESKAYPHMKKLRSRLQRFAEIATASKALKSNAKLYKFLKEPAPTSSKED